MSILKTVETWSMASPTEFLYEQTTTTPKEIKNFGGGLILPIGCAAFKIKGGARGFYLYQSCPGTVPIYFIVDTGVIHVSNSFLSLKKFAATKGFKVKDIQTAKEGVAYHLSSKGFKRYVVDAIAPSTMLTIGMEGAAIYLLELLAEAARPLKGKTVLTPISGGTDGILTALALKLAGVKQVCVCIGRTEEDFDPSFARGYAEQLGLPYTFLPLPTNTADLESLLARALANIEMTDFSNVLMGMCNTLLAEFALANGCSVVATADLADVILGNDIFSYGNFKKENLAPTALGWSQYRVRTGLRTLPNNLQVWKAYNFAGVENTQLFNDRAVIEFLLSLPLELTPPNGKKPLYYAVLAKYLTGGSWESTGKKVGFYTGTGIGKIRLENPVLSDESIRRIFSTL